MNAESIYPLYQSNCTEIVVLSLHDSGTTLNYASFTFLKVGGVWYRLSFVDQQLQCEIDDPRSLRYASIDGASCAFKSTNITALFPLASNRITDIYCVQKHNLIQANLSFLVGCIGICYNIDTGMSRILVLN